MKNNLINLLVNFPKKTLNKAKKLVFEFIEYLPVNPDYHTNLYIQKDVEENPHWKLRSSQLRDSESSDDDPFHKIKLVLRDLEKTISVYEAILYDYLVKSPTTELKVNLCNLIEEKDKFPEHVENLKDGFFSISKQVQWVITTPILHNMYIETFSSINPNKDKQVPLKELIIVWQKEKPGEVLDSRIYNSSTLEIFSNQLTSEKIHSYFLSIIYKNINATKNKKNEQKPNDETNMLYF